MKFKEYRLSHGIKKYALAKASGIHISLLTRYENGEREPLISTAFKIKVGLEKLTKHKHRLDNIFNEYADQ